ncbi:hypothetical protein [uncultured Roseovarius sp.]|uniref:hypothetical protein n=1 Tax=uncultured Roseovarius sp. TaxID=293344 RepID=UPI0026187061|nr:hypothetical protein [uncultured Roseovarius sp.]
MCGAAGDVAGKTIVAAAAGCSAGLVLADGLAGAGGRIVALDRDAGRCHALARLSPERIETLAVDPMQPAGCARLGQLWGNTPIDLLIHLQPLRAPDRLGAVTSAIPALTWALLPGLRAGSGRVLIVNAVPGSGAGAAERACRLGIDHLAEFMQHETEGRIATNTLRIVSGGEPEPDARRVQSAIVSAALFLGFAAPGSRGVQGSTLTVCAACD